MKSLFVAIFLCTFTVIAQDVFKGCPPTGDGKTELIRRLDSLKNRYDMPDAEEFDMSVSVISMLSVKGTFDESSAAHIEGYVVSVKSGDKESCNCHSNNPDDYDTHIVIAVDNKHTGKRQIVIAEVTPRVREAYKELGVNWSTKALKKLLVGHIAAFEGWVFYDSEHENASETTNPGGKNNWRGSPLEIHPVMTLEVVR